MSLLRCVDLEKTYDLGNQKLQVLRKINLSIERGEFVAIMGPSGSGKSTLMNILGCLDTPTAGRYELDGQQVAGMNENQLADVRNRKIGFVFQTFNLLPRQTAQANVALPLVYSGVPLAERNKQAVEALSSVGLRERAGHRPNEMSGGERQRVAIARALINRPSIILADEPTGNLDTRTSIEIMGLLGELYSSGNTIILVTHEPDIAEYAHRVVRVRDGLIESDSPGSGKV